MIKENFIKLYENSFRENWDLPCYTNYGEPESYTYGEVAEEIVNPASYLRPTCGVLSASIPHISYRHQRKNV